MIAQKIVGLDYFHVVDLRRLQNFAAASAPVMFEVARTSPHCLKRCSPGIAPKAR